MSDESVSKSCPQCGAAVPDDAPGGVCPKCLMLQAAASTGGHGLSAEAKSPPSLEAVRAAFPQLEILQVIGQGGMGAVFKARQPKLNRFVALKILPERLAAEPAFAKRFAREGQMLARLSHPNIVAVHDFGESGGFYYLLMEFMDGVNLRQALQVGGFSPQQALGIVPKICEALQYAHDEGVLHRDIKPENILLDTKGRVKIADFGIAKFARENAPGQRLTGEGAALGTPHYMAPEQIERPSDVDHRADIYSLGVVFYELLTGELPLGRFAPPSEKAAVDARVDEVVLKALEKERERRQQSAGELRTEVETITGSGSREMRPLVVGQRSTRRAWVAAALLLLSLLVSFVGAFGGVPAVLFVPALLLGIPATVLGWQHLARLRQAGGREGFAAAIAAALVWPLLLLDGFLLLVIIRPAQAWSGPGARFAVALAGALGIVVCLVADIWLTRRTWRWVTAWPQGGQPSPQPASPAANPWPRRLLGLRTLAIVCAAVVGMGGFVCLASAWRIGQQQYVAVRFLDDDSVGEDLRLAFSLPTDCTLCVCLVETTEDNSRGVIEKILHQHNVPRLHGPWFVTAQEQFHRLFPSNDRRFEVVSVLDWDSLGYRNVAVLATGPEPLRIAPGQAIPVATHEDGRGRLRTLQIRVDGQFPQELLANAAERAGVPRSEKSGADGSNEPQPSPPGPTDQAAAAPLQPSRRTLKLRLDKNGKLLVNGEPYVGEGVEIVQQIRDDAELQVVIEAGEGVAEDDLQRMRQLIDAARQQRDPRKRELWEQIAQRQDPPLRKEALDKLGAMLTSEQNTDREQAVRTLQKAKDVPFDRAPLLAPVRRLIADRRQTGYTRAIAAVQLANLGGGKEDIPLIAALADDPDQFVRKGVAAALYGLDPQGEHPLTAPAVEKLLSDESAGVQGVVHHTIKALWGMPVSPAAELRLIELSKQPGQSGEIGYDTVYYALSTRPVVSKPVAERLAELALSPDTLGHTGRAVWGLSHHPASDDARELVVGTLIRIFDDSLDIGLRQDCIYGLGLQGGDAAVDKLEEISAKEENVTLREQAQSALARAQAKAPSS